MSAVLALRFVVHHRVLGVEGEICEPLIIIHYFCWYRHTDSRVFPCTIYAPIATAHLAARAHARHLVSQCCDLKSTDNMAVGMNFYKIFHNFQSYSSEVKLYCANTYCTIQICIVFTPNPNRGMS